jgi:SAM-dependent methyltransferase
MNELSQIYRTRFETMGREKRERVWNVLCGAFFQKLIPAGSAVFDLACGYGEFINNIEAAKKYGADLNPDSQAYLNHDVEFHLVPATEISRIAPGQVDVVFTSNFLEHLKSKDECNTVMAEVLTLLRPGGKFIVMGPNIRYAFAEYWDYYDHYLPLSHLSLAEGLKINGYEVEKVIPRFLPYTMNNSIPTHPILMRGYLAVPLAWRFMGRQFLVVARKTGK